MNTASLRDLVEATRLTRAGSLLEATALIQKSLSGGSPGPAGRHPPVHDGICIDGTAETIDEHAFAALPWPGRVADRPPAPPRPASARPSGAGFTSGQFANRAGSRPYKLFVPGGREGESLPLIVMLHGCTQSPDDFAAGTRMNEAAEARGCVILYPGQTSAANPSKCWNWFKSSEQRRDQGEPAVIAGMTREVMRRHGIDEGRVYVAGFSAGAAAAAVMGALYPDLYAAIGVHSGLACGAASDMPSAFAAMQGAGARRPAKASGSGRAVVPTIVFHGDRDTTVHPSNGEAVIAEAAPAGLSSRVEEGRTPGGHAWKRVVQSDGEGRVVLEQWTIHGAGHAWSGGSKAGTYTDPRGPDATAAMLRFFLEHPRAE